MAASLEMVALWLEEAGFEKTSSLIRSEILISLRTQKMKRKCRFAIFS
jgi:hypothetical protein